MKAYLIIAGLLLTSCASQDVIVDRKGLDDRQFQQDLVECQAYAEEVRTGTEVLRQGAIGAALGGAIGAVAGNRRTAERAAGVGAVSGAAGGALGAEHRKEHIVHNCLRGRGYRVLG